MGVKLVGAQNQIMIVDVCDKKLGLLLVIREGILRKDVHLLGGHKWDPSHNIFGVVHILD